MDGCSVEEVDLVINILGTEVEAGAGSAAEMQHWRSISIESGGKRAIHDLLRSRCLRKLPLGDEMPVVGGDSMNQQDLPLGVHFASHFAARDVVLGGYPRFVTILVRAAEEKEEHKSGCDRASGDAAGGTAEPLAAIAGRIAAKL